MATRCGIVGAGGLGSALAAFLTEAGRDVVLIGRGGAHVEHVAASGLRMRPPGGTPYRVPVQVATTAKDVADGSVDVLIVLTKAYDTATACATVRHALAPGGVAISLQNGLGADRALAEVFGAERSLVGVTTVGATRNGPGEVTVNGVTAAGRSVTHLGPTRLATGGARAEEVAGLFSGARMPATVVPNAEFPIWEKLALAALSPISSLLRMNVGQVWARPEAAALVEVAFDEVIAVAAAENVALDRDAAWAHARATYQSAGDHFTSMCEDVMNGRRTELEHMAAEIERRATVHGLAVPVHTTLIRLLRTQGVT